MSKLDLTRLARLLRVAQPVRTATAEGVYQSIVVWFSRIKILSLLAVSAVACALFGCASSKVTERRAYAAGDQLPRSSRIIVHNIAATPADIAPDSPLSGVYDRRAKPQGAKEIELGRKLGSQVAQELVKEILALGMPAERARSGPPPGNGDVLIKGAFVSI